MISVNSLCQLLTLLLLTFFPICSNAQFLNLEIDIEPSLTVSVLQTLDFGTVITNSGITRIAPGEPGMGVFLIDALNTQQLLIEFEKPERLTNKESDESIPIDINAAFSEFGRDNILESQPILNNPEQVILRTTPDNQANVWARSYIYIYGSLVVGPVSEGFYTGELVLNITYE